jgi:hypothetical protein
MNIGRIKFLLFYFEKYRQYVKGGEREIGGI